MFSGYFFFRSIVQFIERGLVLHSGQSQFVLFECISLLVFELISI